MDELLGSDGLSRNTRIILAAGLIGLYAYWCYLEGKRAGKREALEELRRAEAERRAWQRLWASIGKEEPPDEAA